MRREDTQRGRERRGDRGEKDDDMREVGRRGNGRRGRRERGYEVEEKGNERGEETDKGELRQGGIKKTKRRGDNRRGEEI